MTRKVHDEKASNSPARYQLVVDGGLALPSPGKHFQEEGSGTLFSAVFTLTNSAVGAGILAFPYAYKCAGLSLGILLTVLFAILMTFTLHVIVRAAHATQSNSYQEIVRQACGHKWEVFMEVVTIVSLFGVCVSFLMIIGDMCSSVLTYYLGHGAMFADRTFLIVTVGSMFVLPLCFIPKISSLKVSSSLAIAAVSYTVLFVITSGLEVIAENGLNTLMQDVEQFNLTPRLFLSIPLICLALQCHTNAAPIYAELKPEVKTVSNMNRVIFAAMGLCMMLYIPTGLFGYITFGSATDPNVMKGGYPMDSPWVNIGRLCMVISSSGAFALQHFPTRIALYELLTSLFGKKDDQLTHSLLDGAPTKVRMPDIYFYTETPLFFFVACVVAIYVPNIAVIFDLLGSTCAMVLIFFFPAAFWWRYGPENQLIRLIPSFLLGFVGFFIAIVSTTTTIMTEIL